MALDNYFRDDDFWAALCVTMSVARGNEGGTLGAGDSKPANKMECRCQK